MFEKFKNYHSMTTESINKKGNFAMQNRIRRVLILSSYYDYFLLEQDGNIKNRIFEEYISLNLRNAPVFKHASSIQKAYRILTGCKVDLVIVMYSQKNQKFRKFTSQIKKSFPIIPLVVLSPLADAENTLFNLTKQTKADHVFSWLGNSDILLAITKLMEDSLNVEHDLNDLGVQAILLVEDTVKFYSGYLPMLYKIILKQTRFFMGEGLNPDYEQLRMKGRPKVLLAKTYEEAEKYFLKYKDNLLGVISDISFNRNGIKNNQAGFELYDLVKKHDTTLPFLIQSADPNNQIIAQEKNIDFIFKTSETLHQEICQYLFDRMGFGDFVFKNSNGEEIQRAKNLKQLQDILLSIPEQILEMHFKRNDISRWLNARAMFPLAKQLRNYSITDFKDIVNSRLFVQLAIMKYRIQNSLGVVIKFDKEIFDSCIQFSKLGEGSMGGKASGLAFSDVFLNRNLTHSQIDGVKISIPRSLVVCTDIYDKFIEQNKIFTRIPEGLNDESILDIFLDSDFEDEWKENIKIFLKYTNKPIAVRSSSLLEDAHYQPYAGVYNTYMIPVTHDYSNLTLDMILDAIKSVYASVFFTTARQYMTATGTRIEDEKMAVILQEVCGDSYDNCYYPTFSGVARSVNFYPLSHEKSTDGIAHIAMGLGKTIVEGGMTLRFSPAHPKKNVNLSTPQSYLRNTQKTFYALDLNHESFTPSISDSINLKKLNINEAHPIVLQSIASTYDRENNYILEGIHHEGKKVIAFSQILNHNTFPIASILKKLLKMGKREMKANVEIEFAVQIDTENSDNSEFHFLQIRPIADDFENCEISKQEWESKDTIIQSNKALGNGNTNEIHDIVYVKTKDFSAKNNPEIALEIEKLNTEFCSQNRKYILIGPGRWGSSDEWLGIPVKWSQISNAGLIIEAGLPHYNIEPSQGTHFFQNLTSFKVGYFTINPHINDGFWNEILLDSFPVCYETESIKWVQTAKPLSIKIDGRRGKGIVTIKK